MFLKYNDATNWKHSYICADVFLKINECGITWHGLRLWRDTTDCNMNSVCAVPKAALCQLFLSHRLVHTLVLWFEKANIDILPQMKSHVLLAPNSRSNQF